MRTLILAFCATALCACSGRHDHNGDWVLDVEKTKATAEFKDMNGADLMLRAASSMSPRILVKDDEFVLFGTKCTVQKAVVLCGEGKKDYSSVIKFADNTMTVRQEDKLPLIYSRAGAVPAPAKIEAGDKKQPDSAAPTAVVGKNDGLPFVGSRGFDFMGGSGTGYAITIREDGQTEISIVGSQSSSVEYKGPFKNPILIKDSNGFLFKEGKVFSISGGRIEKGCKEDGKDCVSDLWPIQHPGEQGKLNLSQALGDKSAIVCRYNESEDVCSEIDDSSMQPVNPEKFAQKKGYKKILKKEKFDDPGTMGTYLKMTIGAVGSAASADTKPGAGSNALQSKPWYPYYEAVTTASGDQECPMAKSIARMVAEQYLPSGELFADLEKTSPQADQHILMAYKNFRAKKPHCFTR